MKRSVALLCAVMLVQLSTALCANGKRWASAEVIEIYDDENNAGPPGPTGGGASRLGLPESTNTDEAVACSLQQACAHPPPAGVYLWCMNDLYLSVCSRILPVYEQESLGWQDLSDDICDRSVADMLASLSMGNSSASQAGAAGCHAYKETSDEGKRVMDNLAAAYANVVFNELNTSSVIPTAAEVVPSAPTTAAATDVGTGMLSAEKVSEGDINTLIEQGINLPDLPDDDAITDSANSTTDSRFVLLVGPLWEYGREARASTTTSERRVPGDWVLVEPPSAIAASDDTRRRFLEEFRTAHAPGLCTQTQCCCAPRRSTLSGSMHSLHSATQPIRHTLVLAGASTQTRQHVPWQDVRTLLAQLHEASPAYYWYVRGSVIVGCGLAGRVPAMDLAILGCQAAIFFVVASYAPWSEVRQNFRDVPRLGAPFALGILGRLMTSILATSGVVFNIFLLCSFPGILSLSRVVSMDKVSYG